MNTRLINGDRGKTSPYSLIQTSSESSAEGEIDFWSYDGPGDTWQGSIYMEVYGQGASTWDGEIDTGSEDYPWDWYNKTWESRDECPPFCPINMKPLLPGDMTNGAIQLASARHGGGDIQLIWNGWTWWADCWRKAVVGGCAGAAITCLRVKAEWPACFAFRCVGIEIGAGIGCAL